MRKMEKKKVGYEDRDRYPRDVDGNWLCRRCREWKVHFPAALCLECRMEVREGRGE